MGGMGGMGEGSIDDRYTLDSDMVDIRMQNGSTLSVQASIVVPA